MKYSALLGISFAIFMNTSCLTAIGGGEDEKEKETTIPNTQMKKSPTEIVKKFSDCLRFNARSERDKLWEKYPSLHEKFQIEYFHDLLFKGEKEKVRKFLEVHPHLAKEQNYWGVGPVVFAFNKDHVDDGNEILALLKEFDADFNEVTLAFGEMPCDMTPLAGCLWLAPNYDEFIAPLIRFGADIFHPTVDGIIKIMSEDIYRLERPRFGSRPTIDRVRAMRDEKPLPPCYEPNTLFSWSPEREEKPRIDKWCPRLASELMPFHFPRRIAGLRYGPSFENKKINGLFIYVEVHDFKNEAQPYSTEMYELSDIQPQKLMLSVLMGEQSPADVFTFLRQLVDSDFEGTVLGRLLYASIGHPEYISPQKMPVIEDQLAHSIAAKIGYTPGDGKRIEQELYDAIKPCRFSALSLVNNFPPLENTFSSYISGDSRNAILHFLHYPPMKIFSIGIESEGLVLSKMCIVLERLDERVAPGPFYFTSNITATMVAKVLLGEVSPWFYDKLLRKSIGTDYAHITGLGRFFEELYGFPEFIGSFGKGQAVDDHLAAQLRKSLGMEKK